MLMQGLNSMISRENSSNYINFHISFFADKKNFAQSLSHYILKFEQTISQLWKGNGLAMIKCKVYEPMMRKCYENCKAPQGHMELSLFQVRFHVWCHLLKGLR